MRRQLNDHTPIHIDLTINKIKLLVWIVCETDMTKVNDPIYGN